MKVKLIIISLVLGTLCAWFVGSVFEIASEYKTPWQALGSPPGRTGRAELNNSGLFVRAYPPNSSEAELYRYCGFNCWEKSDYVLAYTEESFNCEGSPPVHLPTLKYLEKGTSYCVPWEGGIIYKVLAIRQDGEVFKWEKRVGNWDKYIYPLVGLLISFFVSLVWILTATHWNRQSG